MADDYGRHEDSGGGGPDIHEALGQSDAFLEFQEHLSQAAQVNRPVLLVGERGTGKELAAQRLHYLSSRWDAPFVALNCSALAPTLIESELFGHEAGAYTGAGGKRTGRFESAHSGTLFLDEIANIPLQVQEKILRAVEYGTFERVGSSAPVQVDVRIIGATNADLHALADEGKFMPDLIDRLSFDVLVLPPLRERTEDIPLLANHFAARMAFELRWQALPEILDEAMELIENYPWPGNVRELKNVIERAVYRSHDHIIAREEIIFDPLGRYAPRRVQPAASLAGDHPHQLESPGPEPPANGAQTVALDIANGFHETIREVEVRLLRDALERSKFNQKKAAELLGLTYHQFRGVYRKYQDEFAEEG